MRREYAGEAEKRDVARREASDTRADTRAEADRTARTEDARLGREARATEGEATRSTQLTIAEKKDIQVRQDSLNSQLNEILTNKQDELEERQMALFADDGLSAEDRLPGQIPLREQIEQKYEEQRVSAVQATVTQLMDRFPDEFKADSARALETMYYQHGMGAFHSKAAAEEQWGNMNPELFPVDEPIAEVVPENVLPPVPTPIPDEAVAEVDPLGAPGNVQTPTDTAAMQLDMVSPDSAYQQSPGGRLAGGINKFLTGKWGDDPSRQ